MTNEAKHKEIIMQKNEFEVMVKELLPDVTAQAMEKWTQYAQELEQDGTEKALRIGGGLLTVAKNNVTLLSSSCTEEKTE